MCAAVAACASGLRRLGASSSPQRLNSFLSDRTSRILNS